MIQVDRRPSPLPWLTAQAWHRPGPRWLHVSIDHLCGAKWGYPAGGSKAFLPLYEASCPLLYQFWKTINPLGVSCYEMR